MGNTSSLRNLLGKPTNVEGVEAGKNVEEQAKAKKKLYELVKPSLDKTNKDRGTLVEATAKAHKEKDYTELHKLIRKKVSKYLYNGGKGEDISVQELVEWRNAERQKRVTQADKENSPFAKEEENQAFKSNSSEKRKCCWDITKRGAVGETILHVCFLLNTKVHAILAKHLIQIYPNLLHDIYHGEEYYGEAMLHMAMANEDFEMIQLIVEEGKLVGLNLQERCYGKFFCPDDQKATRRDLPNTEVVWVDPVTNYKGFTYWGELPLSFAACLDQADAFKLLVASGADMFATDSNGNNVLHMMVIHNNKDMFNLAYRLSKEYAGKNKKTDQNDGEIENLDASKKYEDRNLLECTNRRGLTPLTLAAKLANKEMFDHILELKSSVVWTYGEVVCKQYSLSDLDTINSKDGSINDLSALNIVLSEESIDHLDMLDGLLYQLLHDKWKAYAKVRFYKRAAGFLFYVALLVTAVYLHPGEPVPVTNSVLNLNGTNCSIPTFGPSTLAVDIARTVFECLVFILAIVFTFFAASEIKHQGISLFAWTLYNAPTKAGFLISCILVILVLPCRMTCAIVVEDVFITLAVCTCLPYCLFFCRGFKLVGPFVVMIYKMIVGDLLRFLIIYSIFLMGFSQAMFVLFRGTPHPLFSSQFESVMAMFSMTLGEFKDLYDSFDSSRNPEAPKLLFLFYMVLVTILLVNMLIAMMGNTFNRIAQTQKEWQRQWAKIVLVMEQSVSPRKRKSKQRRYSQPMGENGLERSLVIRTRIKTKEEDQTKLQSYLNRFKQRVEDSISSSTESLKNTGVE